MKAVEMMKKLVCMVMTLMLALSAACALAEVPAEIMALLDVKAWEDYHVPTTTLDPERHACFLADTGVVVDTNPVGVMIAKKGDNNVLCLLQKRSGQWRITGRNHNAIPDGDNIPYIDFDLHDDIDLFYDEVPAAGIRSIGLAYDGKTVRVDEVVFAGGYWDRAAITGSGITYSAYDETGNLVARKTVYGVYNASFEAFNYRYFPKTPEEADALLTVAPVIPKNQGDPNALKSPVELNLRTGEKYDVFSAPGRSSYRPANGKAVMSTNDWVQIFGEEDGWVLVQYDISSGEMRFGYVDASVLPRNANIRQLSWASIPYTTVVRTALTDDPLNSCKQLMQLPEGEQVTCLATMGSWLYVETELNGRAVRGFIPVVDAAPTEPDQGWDTLYPNG